MSKELRQGSYCHYSPAHGNKENGRIKSIGNEYAFVVFSCNNEWDRYEDYTGQRVAISDLRPGWIDGSHKDCNHHYIPTNAKWQSINQRKCVHCGDVIN